MTADKKVTGEREEDVGRVSDVRVACEESVSARLRSSALETHLLLLNPHLLLLLLLLDLALLPRLRSHLCRRPVGVQHRHSLNRLVDASRLDSLRCHEVAVKNLSVSSAVANPMVGRPVPVLHLLNSVNSR